MSLGTRLNLRWEQPGNEGRAIWPNLILRPSFYHVFWALTAPCATSYTPLAVWSYLAPRLFPTPDPLLLNFTHTCTHSLSSFLTSVAKHFAAEYGCLRLSVGEAMRRVIEQFPESELTRLMQSFLQAGQVVPDDLCVLALERTLLDVQCNTRGWVAKGLTWLSEFAIAWSILGSIGGVLCWWGKV